MYTAIPTAGMTREEWLLARKEDYRAQDAESVSGSHYGQYLLSYLQKMTDNYAAGQDLENPLISPLFGNYEGFPPTYIQAGDNEILLNDATMLHKKMVKENVSVKIDIFKGMWHVFQMSPFKTAYEAMDKNAEFIYDICR